MSPMPEFPVPVPQDQQQVDGDQKENVGNRRTPGLYATHRGFRRAELTDNNTGAPPQGALRYEESE